VTTEPPGTLWRTGIPPPHEAGPAVRGIEIDGFVVFPGVLAPSEVAVLSEELLGLDAVKQHAKARLRVVRDVHLSVARRAVELIADPAMLGFVRRTLGDDIVCMSASFACYEPGYRGMALHTDCQPYGSDLFGPLASVPISIRVFWYLDGLSPDRAPLRVVPSSHLSLHQAANPYQRFAAHPEEEVVTCPAGSAVVINPRMFHGVGANRSDQTRSVYTMSYRPGWAGPIRRVPGRRVGATGELPPPVRSLFKPPNMRRADPRLPINAATAGEAPAPLGRSRWVPEPTDEQGARRWAPTS
jgi:phytanoyl-CoA dioxygenase PhyH